MKKYELNIDLNNEAPLSKFVIDLKKRQPIKVAAKYDNVRPDDYSASPNLLKTPKSSLLDFNKNKLKEHFMYPVFSLVYKILYKTTSWAHPAIIKIKNNYKASLAKKMQIAGEKRIQEFNADLIKKELLLKNKAKDIAKDIVRRETLIKSAVQDVAQEVVKKEKEFFKDFNYYKNKAEDKVEAIADDVLDKIAAKKKAGQPPRHWRQIFTFLLFLFVLIIPFKVLSYYHLINTDDLKNKILSRSQSALDSLKSAAASAQELKLGDASQNFSAAAESFVAAEDDLKKIDELLFSLASFSNNDQMKLAAVSREIMAAGEASARLGNNLTLAFDSLKTSDQDRPDINLIIDNFVKNSQAAISSAKDLNQILTKIKAEELPENYQETFRFLKEKSVTLEHGLEEFTDLALGLKEFLGGKDSRRYLLVFQNNNELRASGGFIGSYALVDFKNGKINKIEVPAGGSYDTEGGMKVLVAAPKPLSLLNPRWFFWDANWWPDWPMSARNLMWFYDKSSGPSVDGVISITPTVLEKLLEVLGSVDMTKDYGVVITSDNFWELTQGIVEKTGNPELHASTTVGASIDSATSTDKTKPKKIIGDLFNKILEELPRRLDKNKVVKILKALDTSLSEKQILLYFNESDLEKKMVDNGWGGEIKQNSGDYLAVINTNIGGGKSDRMIEESIAHTVEIESDGSIIDYLTISRLHKAQKREPFVGVRNVDWMRVYVPQGSSLLEAQGFVAPDSKYFETADPSWQKNNFVLAAESQALTHAPSGTQIYEENGKTVFANWSMVDPGEAAVINLKYKLPFKIKTQETDNKIIKKINDLINPNAAEIYSYSLLVQKQAGAKASVFNDVLRADNNYKIFWQAPQNLNIGDNGWKINDVLNQDKFYSILLKK